MKRLFFALCLFIQFVPVLADDQSNLVEARKALEAENYAKALSLIKPLAEKGNREAEHTLGIMFYVGQGVTRDYQEAFKWWLRASLAGHANARYNLGVLYEQGKGVEQNCEKAEKWYRLAANQTKDMESKHLADKALFTLCIPSRYGFGH